MANKTQEAQDTTTNNQAPKTQPKKEGWIGKAFVSGSLVSPLDVATGVPLGFGLQAILSKAAEAFVLNHPVGAAAIAFGSGLGIARGSRAGITALVRRNREKNGK